MSGPALARLTGNGRVYRHPLTGVEVLSVTTAISAGLAKPFLAPAAVKVTAESVVRDWDSLSGLESGDRITTIKRYHRNAWDKKADLGTAVHEAVEAYCNDTQPPEWPPEVAGHLSMFGEFLTARRPVFLHNEATVWSHAHGYAGTFDFIAEIGGITTLVDIKTGKAVYPEVALQLEAMRRADCIILPDGTELPIPDITQLAALHIRPKSWGLYAVAGGDQTFEAFLSSLRLAYWKRDVEHTVLGPRLGIPA